MRNTVLMMMLHRMMHVSHHQQCKTLFSWCCCTGWWMSLFFNDKLGRNMLQISMALFLICGSSTSKIAEQMAISCFRCYWWWLCWTGWQGAAPWSNNESSDIHPFLLLSFLLLNVDSKLFSWMNKLFQKSGWPSMTEMINCMRRKWTLWQSNIVFPVIWHDLLRHNTK